MTVMYKSVTSLLRIPLVAWLAVSLLASCAPTVPVVDVPAGLQIQRIGAAKIDGPLAWNPDGARYAAASRGLQFGLAGGESRTVHAASPSALSWSPTGSLLAASSASADRSVVRIFGDDGTSLAELAVAGSVMDLGWISDDELLMAAVQLREFSFGGNYSVRLYRWRQNEEPTSESLVDTSPLRQTLAALGTSIYESVHLQVSPYRDEILYTRLMTPPNAPIRYTLVARNLASGREKVIAELSFGSSGGRYLGNGDTVFFSDGQYQSIKRSIWGTDAYETYRAGLSLEISPGGGIMLIDETLLQDRRALFTLPSPGRAAFSPDGSHLLFTSPGGLYLVSGLIDAPVSRPMVTPRLLELRRWRSEGLITPQDYLRHSRPAGAK